MPDPQQQQPTRVRYVVMAFLGSLAFLTYFDRVCISSARVVDGIKADLGISQQQMGLIMGGILAGVRAVRAADRPDGRPLRRTRHAHARRAGVVAVHVFVRRGDGIRIAAHLTASCSARAKRGAFPNMARVQSRWLPIASRGRAACCG